MPKGHSGIKRNNGKAKNERTMTPEEVLQSNIKETEEIAARGFMPEGAIYYPGTLEEKTKFYEAVDRIYKNLPEGYGYSFQPPRPTYGNKHDFIEIQLVTKSREYDRRTGKMKTQRHTAGISHEKYSYPEGITSRSALRGFAKVMTYRAAGKIYDSATMGASEKYPALDWYGEPKKINIGA